MSELNEGRPASAAAGKKPEPKRCPACDRALLTQTSALCNWCGAKIDDPEFLKEAAEARLARDSAERAALEGLVQEEARYGVLGRLRRRAKTNPGTASSIDLHDMEP